MVMSFTEKSRKGGQTAATFALPLPPGYPLTKEEADVLTFQIGMSKPSGRGGRRYLPYAFTEQGVAMLSSVLNSRRAVQVNIAIMRRAPERPASSLVHFFKRDRSDPPVILKNLTAELGGLQFHG